jgi:hypothetical protein
MAADPPAAGRPVYRVLLRPRGRCRGGCPMTWVAWHIPPDKGRWWALCEGPTRANVVRGLRLASLRRLPGCYAALPSRCGPPRWHVRQVE